MFTGPAAGLLKKILSDNCLEQNYFGIFFPSGERLIPNQMDAWTSKPYTLQFYLHSDDSPAESVR